MILAEYLAPHIFKPITSLREVITFPGYYFCMSGSRKFSQWEGAGEGSDGKFQHGKNK